MNFTAFFALLATILALLLTPLQSFIWNGESTPQYLLKMRELISVFLRMRTELSPETTDYYFFGRMTIFIHFGIILGLKELYKNGFFPNSVLKIFNVVVGILSLAAFGNLIAYWGGSFFGELFRNIGFRWIEAPSIFLLLFAIGYLGFKMRAEKKWEGNVIFSLPVLMIGSTLFFRYIPHGPLLPILIVITGFVLSSESAPILQKISRSFLKITSVKSIIILFAFAMLCAETMQLIEKWIPITETGFLPKKMDFRPFSSSQDIVEVFGAYGEQGRKLYFWIDIVDMIFPIPLFLSFAGIYTRAAQKIGLPMSFNLLSLGFLIFDILENSFMFYFLASWPNVPEPLATLNGAVTATKLFFLFVGFTMFFVSFLILVLDWIREKRKKISA
ncbi:hypothetical protein A0128_01740 [Leptospira tipperaryensis]|uniref:Uncharacterized protein n=1 Tax=Leptospira tipperaryensis TaxID=2564040 RepID=A0A1D7USV4_9LEPT|nr:hypothetical protein [Leptospira tipperaryensis]AOP32702.1 hypothetical protein A0128_01740 [Leptospira tipperaryensis]